MKYILLRQCTCAFNHYCTIAWQILLNVIVWIEIEKKLNEIHYKNQETWSESGVFLFFFCYYIFALSLDWAKVLVKILFISCWNYTWPCREVIFWYLFVNYSTFLFSKRGYKKFCVDFCLDCIYFVLIFQ